MRESALSNFPNLMNKLSSCSDSPHELHDIHASDSGTLASPLAHAPGSPGNPRSEEGPFRGSFQNLPPSAFATLQQQSALAAMHPRGHSGIAPMPHLHKSTSEPVQRISSGITKLSHSDSDQLSPRTQGLVNAQMAQQARSDSCAPGGAVNRAFCASPLGKHDPSGAGTAFLININICILGDSVMGRHAAGLYSHLSAISSKERE